ncbi:MAG: hypothetical protein ACM3QW_09485, partial [Ignavibacteriales bacterium]
MQQYLSTLGFVDSALEQEFITYYDYNMRGFNKSGILLSFVGWFLLNIFFYKNFPEYFMAVTIAIGSFLYPLFIFVLLVLRSPRMATYYQPLSALANGMAGFVFIYVGNYILNSNTSTLFGIITCIVFAFFILRLRFKYAVITTLVYVGAYQFSILPSSGPVTTEAALLS